jgi:hypothetical protein
MKGEISCCAIALVGARPPHYWSLEITLRHTTLGRTILDDGSARCRDLHLTTHIIQKSQTSIPPVGFEPEILASGEPQTHIVDYVATGIVKSKNRIAYFRIILYIPVPFLRDFWFHFELRFRKHNCNRSVMTVTDTNTIFVRSCEFNVYFVPYSYK